MTADRSARGSTRLPGLFPRVPHALVGLEDGWASRFRIHLRNPRFWVVQAMILGVAGGHVIGELFWETDLGPTYFIPASLYFFPVVYASLNFGREGAMPTALWSALIAVPNVVLWHHGLERAGESFQLLLMVFVALVVATRVDRESHMRHRSETSEQARSVSELKYRALFDRAGEAILVVDGDGVVQEGNAAAATLLSRSPASLRGAPIDDLLGAKARSSVSSGGAGRRSDAPDVGLRRPDGSEAWFQLVSTPVSATDPAALVQVLLRDVTEQRGFQHYAQEIVRAQEDERQRIAHELHDVSLQSAVLICRRLDAVADDAAQGDTGRLATGLAEARRMAEAMGDEIRRFSRDLRPLILEDLGLVPALRQVVSDLHERSTIQCRLTVTGGTRRLVPAVELALFRVAQEALRNVERHSGASRSSIRLTHRPDGVALTVKDNGSGFEVPALSTLLGARRLGLLGMQERARLVGGRCEIQSSPGNGSRVEVWVPAAECQA